MGDDEDLDAILTELDTNSREYGTFQVGNRKFKPDADVDEFLKENANKQTKRKTDSDLKIFSEYLLSKGERRNMIYIPPDQLDKLICGFLLSVTKRNGGEYEPTTLRSMVSSMDRCLRDNGSHSSIMRNIDVAENEGMILKN